MKKTSILLVAVLAICLLVSCGAPQKSTDSNKISEVMSTEKNALKETQEEQTKPMVTDAYSEFLTGGGETYCYHIPKINLPGDVANKINTDLYDAHYAFLEKVHEDMRYPAISGLHYKWAEKNGVVSILTAAPNNIWDGVEYVVCNVLTANGEKIQTDELLNGFGLSYDSFSQQLKVRLEEKIKTLYGQAYQNNKDNPGFKELYREILNKTLADDNLQQTVPFIEENGDLCAVAKIYSMAGAESYCQLINVTGTVEPAEPNCEIAHGKN